MKKLLSFLIIGLMVVMIGAVSAVAVNAVDTYDSGSYTVLKDTFNQGETVYGKGVDGPWNVRLVYKNPSNAVVQTCPANVGITTCNLALASNAPTGTWTVEVQYQAGTWTTFDTESFIVNAVVTNPTCAAIVTLPGYPTSGWYTGPVDVEWTYDPVDCPIEPNQYVNLAKNGDLKYNLVYYLDTATRTYTWNPVADAEEGQGYSICMDTEIAGTANEADGCSREFNVDTTNPVLIEQNAICNEGETITLTATATDDISGIDGSSWEWDLDNDGYYETSGQHPSYYCKDGPAVETVRVKVSDIAGNAAGETATVTISNVAPTCSIDTWPVDTPLIGGNAYASFDASGNDPAESEDTLTYTWNFGDNSSLVNGEAVEHNYTTAGDKIVTLTINDEDGGSSSCGPVTVKVIEPVQLENQEVAAFYPFSYSFDTELNAVDCQDITSPTGMLILESGSNCNVEWNRNYWANPTNDQRGNNAVIIRVESDSEVNYYSLNVMVYSWIIDLKAGWNLISIPLVAEEDSTIQNVILTPLAGKLAEGYSVYSYQFDGTQSKWFKSDVNSTGDLDSITPGYGYWVKVTEDTVLKGMGKEKDEGAAVPPETQVPTNRWSLIGRYGILGYDWNPAQSLDQRVHGPLIKSTALDSVKVWSDTLNVYTDNSGNIESVDLLYNNEGYWLWVEDDSTHESQIAGYAPIDPYYEYNNVDSAMVE